jgi:hypothetical protein
VTEVAAIGNIHLVVTCHALRHGREIRFASDLRRADAFVTRQARNRSHVLVMREVRQSDLARLLDRGRRLVTLQTNFRLRQIIVFDTLALLERDMACGAFKLQCEMRAVRKIGGR